MAGWPDSVEAALAAAAADPEENSTHYLPGSAQIRENCSPARHGGTIAGLPSSHLPYAIFFLFLCII